MCQSHTANTWPSLDSNPSLQKHTIETWIVFFQQLEKALSRARQQHQGPC